MRLTICAAFLIESEQVSFNQRILLIQRELRISEWPRLMQARKEQREKKAKARNNGCTRPRVLGTGRNFRCNVEEEKGNEKIIGETGRRVLL